MKYIFAKKSDLLTISQAARETGISLQRFRRAVKLLKIPVTTAGWNVLVTQAQMQQVVKAFKDKKITRGRKHA